MQFRNAYLFLIQKLDKELPANLFYHNSQHTKDVIIAAEIIAKDEGVSDNELILLKTAALFHDAGFLNAYKDHEKYSCLVAKDILPHFEYNEEDIADICEMIEATKMPQSPHNKLSEILCDADLFYLGTDHFSEKSEQLYKEVHAQNLFHNKKEWIKHEIDFLGAHLYFTKAAKAKLNKKMEENLSGLRQNTVFQNKKKTHAYRLFNDVIFIIIGVFTAAFSLKGFLVPNNFFDGGITGISLLVHELYHYNLAYVIVLANLPFVIMCVYAINLKYALKTFFCILLLAICLLYLPYPIITSDKLLVSIFGGFFLGLGVGFTMRAGCAIDGIEVLALYTWRRTSFTISEIILALNIIIFSIAAFKFGIETSLYSMLTYFTASKTIDYVIEGIEAYQGVTIISGKSEIIKDKLVNELGRGITVYKGERGFLPGKFEVHNDCDIIFTVITRLELRKLKNLVSEVDTNAFVFASTIKEASGGIIKRRHIH
jgi:uncharacterized membrane-anchored protein YitT (DUF2179 family)/predicted metal-dependent HD superfamily phosphohydrolase